MLLFNLFITLFVPLILGIFILSAILQNASRYSLYERLALSFVIGIGYLTLLMYLLGLFNLPITFITVCLSTLIFIAILIPFIIIKRNFLITINDLRNIKFNSLSTPELILVFLITIKVFFVFFTALVKPMIDVDAFWQYTIVAKGVFFEHTFRLPYFYSGIGDKPLFNFLSQGWVFLGIHTINDAMVKIIPALFFACFLIIFFSILRRSFDRFPALLFTFLLSTFPFMVYHATTAYSDFPITLFFSAGTLYLFQFFKETDEKKARTDLILGLVLLALCIWTKRAGVMLVAIDLFVLAIYYFANKTKFNLKTLLVAVLIFILTIGPWLFIGFSRSWTYIQVAKSIVGVEAAPQAALTPTTTQPLPSLSERISSSLEIFGRKLFLYADWHLLYLLFLVTLIFFYRKSFSRPTVFLLAIILVDILIIFIQFQSGEMYRWLLDGTLLDRLMMNQAPVILYFCAEAIIPGWKDNSAGSAVRVSSKNKKDLGNEHKSRG